MLKITLIHGLLSARAFPLALDPKRFAVDASLRELSVGVC